MLACVRVPVHADLTLWVFGPCCMLFFSCGIFSCGSLLICDCHVGVSTAWLTCSDSCGVVYLRFRWPCGCSALYLVIDVHVGSWDAFFRFLISCVRMCFSLRSFPVWLDISAAMGKNTAPPKTKPPPSDSGSQSSHVSTDNTKKKLVSVLPSKQPVWFSYVFLDHFVLYRL